MNLKIIEWLIEYKWFIIFVCETIAWISTFLMFYCRYWLISKRGFWLNTVIAGVTGYIPHIVLAVMDFLQEGKISGFIIFIVILLIFGAIFGKKLVIKIDQSMMKWSAKQREKFNSSN